MLKTIPIDEILPLPMDEIAVPYMELYYDALHEMVCFGTHLLDWSLQPVSTKAPELDETALAVPLLFRHILELLDAVSVQVKVGVIVPIQIQLRALLEASLSLEYMLQKDRHYRAACFLVVDHYRKLDYYKRIAPNTLENRKLSEDLKLHAEFMPVLEPVKEATEMIAITQAIIDSPIYARAKQAFLDATSGHKKNLDVKWYALSGGPSSVVWLAKRLRRYDLYEVFYRAWSNPTHGTDLLSGTLVRADPHQQRGNAAFIQLRNVAAAHELVTAVISMMVRIYQDIIGKKVVSEHRTEIASWYTTFRTDYQRRVEKNRINIIV